MNSSDPAPNTRVATQCAIAMFAGGGLVGFIALAIPGGPHFSIVPSSLALVLAGILAAVGPRLSRPALALFGPVGVVLLALALASRQGSGDGALIYVWPVLWTSYFYGRKGTALIVVSVGCAHAVAVNSYPHGQADVDRWIEVVVAVTVIAVVVQILVRRADQLVSQLGHSEAQFRELADRTPDIVFRLSRSPEPHFAYLSPSFEHITGIPVATVEDDFQAFADRLGKVGRAVLAAVIADRAFQPHVDLPFRRRDGTIGVFDLHAVKTADGVQGIARDVTEIRALQAQLAEQATRDPLTGLANRRLLDELLGQALGRVNRSGTHLTVAVLDLDGFKAVNDTHGHEAGDVVLRTMAARLQSAVRDADVVARYGGDEFVVVYESVDDNTVRGLVERIHSALSDPIDIGAGVTVRCRVSIGIADTRTTDPDASALINAADRSMLDSKKRPAPTPRTDTRHG